MGVGCDAFEARNIGYWAVPVVARYLRIGAKGPLECYTFRGTIVYILGCNDLIWSNSTLDPHLECFQQVMLRVDDRSMIVSVSKRIRTRASVTMSHPRGHKNPVEALRISHHAADLAVVVEAVLGRNSTVCPTSVLDQFPAVSPE